MLVERREQCVGESRLMGIGEDADNEGIIRIENAELNVSDV